MDVNNMKNIVVLKQLPSNIIEEAIVILKSNKEVKNLEYIEQKANKEKNKQIDNKNQKNYILKEAEVVISDYLEKIERQKERKYKNYNALEKKYKRLKIVSIVSLVISMLLTIF